MHTVLRSLSHHMISKAKCSPSRPRYVSCPMHDGFAPLQTLKLVDVVNSTNLLLGHNAHFLTPRLARLCDFFSLSLCFIFHRLSKLSSEIINQLLALVSLRLLIHYVLSLLGLLNYIRTVVIRTRGGV